MAKFDDLASELQEAGPWWSLSGVYWVEAEGIPYAPDFVHDSLCMAGWDKFDCISQTQHDVRHPRQRSLKIAKCAKAETDEPGPLFRHLLTTTRYCAGRL